MSSFPILDLVIGMIFIYFLLSIISSSMVEMILTYFKLRAKNLESWLTTIFKEKVGDTSISLGEVLLDHPSITALSDSGKSNSYIDAGNFVSALLEQIVSSTNTIPKNIDDFITAIQNTTILSPELQRVFIMYANEAKQTYAEVTQKTASEIDLFRTKIENWYDTSMDRVSGKLKTTYSRPFTFWIALVIVFLINADSIAISKYLYSNPDARAKVAAEALNEAKDSAFVKKMQQLSAAKEDTAGTAEIKKEWNNINTATAALNDAIPLGWKKDELCADMSSWTSFLSKIAGLFLTIFAIMMGAPFWFDLLNKVSNLRGSGTKPVSSTDNND